MDHFKQVCQQIYFHYLIIHYLLTRSGMVNRNKLVQFSMGHLKSIRPKKAMINYKFKGSLFVSRLFGKFFLLELKTLGQVGRKCSKRRGYFQTSKDNSNCNSHREMKFLSKHHLCKSGFLVWADEN